VKTQQKGVEEFPEALAVPQAQPLHAFDNSIGGSK